MDHSGNGHKQCNLPTVEVMSTTARVPSAVVAWHVWGGDFFTTAEKAAMKGKNAMKKAMTGKAGALHRGKTDAFDARAANLM